MPKAYIMFTDSELLWTKPFKKNFRHVSILLPLVDAYVHIDPMMSKIEYRHISDDLIDLMYQNAVENDAVIITADIAPNDYRYRLPMIFTCVELVKRVLGINRWWILTPYQLYKHIIKETTNGFEKTYH